MPPFILIPNTILQWRLVGAAWGELRLLPTHCLAAPQASPRATAAACCCVAHHPPLPVPPPRSCALKCTHTHAQITPMKYHVGGTMLAAALAFERGWAINVGGGMHHGFRWVLTPHLESNPSCPTRLCLTCVHACACSSDGMGWCPFDDIMLAVRRVRSASNGAVRKVGLWPCREVQACSNPRVRRMEAALAVVGAPANTLPRARPALRRSCTLTLTRTRATACAATSWSSTTR